MGSLIRETQQQGYDCMRLRLRPLRLADAQDMYAYTSCEQSCQFLKWGPHLDISEAVNYIKSAVAQPPSACEIVWGIEEKRSGRLIGTLRIYHITNTEASVSYMLNKDYSGKGFMTEAVCAAVDVCFSRLKLQTVFAFSVEENVASRRVLERCGMQVSQHAPQKVVMRNKELNMLEYMISNEGKT